MTERIAHKTVNFQHPFELVGIEGENPAGTFTVETIEEPLTGLSFTAYRRVSTTITLVSRQLGVASRQVVSIEPSDLEAALSRDAVRAAPYPAQ